MEFPLARHPHVVRLVELAIEEDMPQGDITTEAVLKGTEFAEADFRVKADGVLAGLPIVEMVLHRVDPGLGLELHRDDGDVVENGVCAATVAGRAASILMAERVALNFLQRMSGIATATYDMVKAISHTNARIVDTRKTAPGWRALEKYAVRMGRGSNLRFSLSDGILIKDNHIEACGSIALAVERARARCPHLTRIEVECTRLEQVQDALDAGADAVLLDNMEPDTLRKAVRMVAGRATTEASGGINLSTVKAVAETGVDLISAGAVTHSARALDISLDFLRPDPGLERRLQRVR